MSNELQFRQRKLCKRFSANYKPCDLSLKIGISQAVLDGERPINGVRVKEENGTSGWYFWAGEWSDDPDFFLPLHGTHLSKHAEIVLPYLALPEGWRFLIEEDYEDVWFDSELDA
ncbi:hypothetical protein M9194_05915 [Vibrio sp. S4M6]|uniref:immunity protein Imm33 domain-containing protein n=1 Tax=Vibrio sinus TaxID=2946865 RepID=UPI00202A3DAF|nr:hypothetical protein [Vibrio sinus]MCL9780967.1 hypothetical protein [Vibrio sinus]